MLKAVRKSLAFVDQVHKQIQSSDVRLLANSLAYSTVLSLIPFFAVSLSVYHAFGGIDELFRKFTPVILQNLFEGASPEFVGNIQATLFKIKPRALGAAGFLGLLYTSTNLLMDMEMAVQRVWALKSDRSLTLRLFVSWLIIFLGPLMLAIFVGFFLLNVGTYFQLHKTQLSYALVFLLLFLVYKFVPNFKVQNKIALVSSALATVALFTGQKIFFALTKEIFLFGKVYGSLATIPIFFLWVSILCGLYKWSRHKCDPRAQAATYSP